MRFVSRVSYMRGAQAAQGKAGQKTGEHNEPGAVSGFEVQIPDLSNDAINGILNEAKSLYPHLITPDTDALTPPHASPASDKIVNNKNDTVPVTVSKETEPQIVQQPLTVDEPKTNSEIASDKITSDKTASTKVTPTKTTTNNKRKSDAENCSKAKKARTNKSDAPTIQPSVQLILPNAPLITSEPQSVEAAESTQVTQPAADAYADTEMGDAPSEPEVSQEFAQPEMIDQPEPIAEPGYALWPESEPQPGLFAPPDMFMNGSPEPFNGYIQAGFEREDPLMHRSAEEGLLFLQQTMNQEEQQPQQQEDDLFGEFIEMNPFDPAQWQF